MKVRLVKGRYEVKVSKRTVSRMKVRLVKGW